MSPEHRLAGREKYAEKSPAELQKMANSSKSSYDIRKV